MLDLEKQLLWERVMREGKTPVTLTDFLTKDVGGIRLPAWVWWLALFLVFLPVRCTYHISL